MTLEFSDLDTASKVQTFIKQTFRTTLAAKVKPLPASAPSIPLPVRYDDPLVPKGLVVIPEYVSVAEEEALITAIDSEAWDTTIRRRVQHYGFQFEYSKLTVDTERPVKPFPPKCDELTHRSELSDHGFNQLTINEYVPGIGIASHCDTHSSFTDIIAVVSLGGPINMDFVSDCGSKKFPLRYLIAAFILCLGTADTAGGTEWLAERQTVTWRVICEAEDAEYHLHGAIAWRNLVTADSHPFATLRGRTSHGLAA